MVGWRSHDRVTVQTDRNGRQLINLESDHLRKKTVSSSRVVWLAVLLPSV